jgi:hypothetical protein
MNMPNSAMSQKGQAGPSGGAVVTNGSGKTALQKEQEVLIGLDLRVRKLIKVNTKKGILCFRVAAIDHDTAAIWAREVKTPDGAGSSRKTRISPSDVEEVVVGRNPLIRS